MPSAFEGTNKIPIGEELLSDAVEKQCFIPIIALMYTYIHIQTNIDFSRLIFTIEITSNCLLFLFNDHIFDRNTPHWITTMSGLVAETVACVGSKVYFGLMSLMDRKHQGAISDTVNHFQQITTPDHVVLETYKRATGTLASNRENTLVRCDYVSRVHCLS